jgi:hypothetical protein
MGSGGFGASNLPPQFRFAVLAAKELLGVLVEKRAEALRAVTDGVPFDWTAAIDRLRKQSDATRTFYLPIEHACVLANKARDSVTCGSTEDSTAFAVILTLADDTIESLWQMRSSTANGEPRMSAEQREFYQRVLDVIGENASALKVQLEKEAIGAEACVGRGDAKPPEAVARTVFGGKLVVDYLESIGAVPDALLDGLRKVRIELNETLEQECQSEAYVVSPALCEAVDHFDKLLRLAGVDQWIPPDANDPTILKAGMKADTIRKMLAQADSAVAQVVENSLGSPPASANSDQREGNGGDSNLEWSKPVSYKSLRDALTISQNTLKARLVKSKKPVEGKIRYTAPTKTAKKIQVVVIDLPSDLQARFRRSSK